MSLVRALRVRSFALLWSGQAISMFGDRIFQVALAWWVLEETGSALAMGTLFVVTTIPTLVFLLIGGVMVDRFPRLWLLVISDVSRGAVIAIMAALALTNQLALWHVYAISLVSGFVEAFVMPAYRAAVPELTPEEHLTSANSLTNLSTQFSGIAGPAAGAALVALGGTPLAFALDAASFFISALLLVPLLRHATSPQRNEESKSIFRDLREGLATVLGSAWLWVAIGIAGVSNIAYAGPMEVGLPFLLAEEKGAGVEALGVFYSLSSAGAVLAAVWLGRKQRLRRRGLTLYGSWMIVGIMVALIGLPVPLPVVFAAAFVIGACNTTLGLVWVNSLQERIPPQLLGRVSSIDYLGSFVLLPLGYGIGGWASDAIGTPNVFILGGLLQTSLIALGLLHPEIRNMD